MNIQIWDNWAEKWINKKNVRYIVQLNKEHFKIDDISYSTYRYELNFIHSEG